MEETDHCCQKNGRVVICRYIKIFSQEGINTSERKYNVAKTRRDGSGGVAGRQRHYAAARHVSSSTIRPNSANQRRFPGREFITYEGRGAPVI